MGNSLKFAALTLSLAVVAVAVGCGSKPDDKHIAQAIESQFEKDSVGGGITIQSAAGVVTLNGQVSSDAQRTLATRDAAAASGVKEVINNLTVAPPAPAEHAQRAEPAPAPLPEKTRQSRRHAPYHRAAAEADYAAETPAPAPASPPVPPPPGRNMSAVAVASPAPELPPPPPPPPAPVKITVPAGTVVSVRLIDSLDSSRNRVGDVFRATLNAPIREDGETVIPAGADVQGRVADVSSAGRFSGHSELSLELTRLTSNGKEYALQTAAYDRSEQGRGKGTAESVGGGAALGAIIGALGGGGKGAAIGTIAGAGAGGAVRGAKGGGSVAFPSETVLSFKLDAPLTVVIMKGNAAGPSRSHMSY